MKIGFRRRLSHLLFTVGLLFGLLVLLVAPAIGWDSDLAYMTGWALFWIIFSVLLRKRTYIELKEKNLTIYPLMPLINRKGIDYEFRSADDFELVKNRLYLRQDGKRKRILISPYYIESADWTAFLKALNLVS